MGRVSAGNLYGTLEMLILRALELSGPLHGVGVADRIAEGSLGRFQIEEGSLYPALHRLQAKGYVAWEWMKTEDGKRAKYYEITPAGRRALARELKGWLSSVHAMLSLLDVSIEDVR